MTKPDRYPETGGGTPVQIREIRRSLRYLLEEWLPERHPHICEHPVSKERVFTLTLPEYQALRERLTSIDGNLGELLGNFVE